MSEGPKNEARGAAHSRAWLKVVKNVVYTTLTIKTKDNRKYAIKYTLHLSETPFLLCVEPPACTEQRREVGI